MIDLEQVRKDAEAEVASEDHRKAVEREKERVRRRKNFWVRIFPWRFRLVKLLHPYPTREEARDHHISALKRLGYKDITLYYAGWYERH